MTASKVQLVAAQQPIPRTIELRSATQTRALPAVTRRCLFGVPDPKELDAIYQRNLERERQRMINNYAFDPKTEKFVGPSGTEQANAKASTKPSSKPNKTSSSNEIESQSVGNSRKSTSMTATSSVATKSVNNKKGTTQKCNIPNAVIAKALLSPKKPYDRQCLANKQKTLTGNFIFYQFLCLGQVLKVICRFRLD